MRSRSCRQVLAPCSPRSGQSSGGTVSLRRVPSARTGRAQRARKLDRRHQHRVGAEEVGDQLVDAEETEHEGEVARRVRVVARRPVHYGGVDCGARVRGRRVVGLAFYYAQGHYLDEISPTVVKTCSAWSNKQSNNGMYC
jgi:hypothetical protein